MRRYRQYLNNPDVIIGIKIFSLIVVIGVVTAAIVITTGY